LVMTRSLTDLTRRTVIHVTRVRVRVYADNPFSCQMCQPTNLSAFLADASARTFACSSRAEVERDQAGNAALAPCWDDRRYAFLRQ
jgi:hypothetical protein